MRALIAGLSLLLLLTGCGKEPTTKVEPKAGGTPAEALAAQQQPPKPPTAEPAQVPQLLTAEEIDAGWLSLFDGHSLFGWEQNSNVDWHVEDGMIVGSEGDIGILHTITPWADFELRCEFFLVEGGNSGVFLRTAHNPTSAAEDCYELNICDRHPAGFTTGSFVDRKKADVEVKGEGAWHKFHVRCEGNHIVVQIDGSTVLDWVDESEHALAKGYVGLQKNSGRVQFKNVFLKPLGLKPLFNGTDLAGWHEVPGSKSKFEIADGTIHVSNGPGFLESDGQYGDFVLQAQAKTNGENLNSGIFFRAMPGTEQAPSNGYEVQVHSGIKENDPTKPLDFGTGAIFRRQPARRVMSKDKEWATITLAAAGPRFATWVNGYPVVDWTDEREPKENPREGKRLEAGHLILQGHDPTTDLNFRNLQAAEFPK